MIKNYIIYKHTNLINGKVYIGQTCQKPEARWDNGNGYSKCPKFYLAIKKYGWENFNHEILESNLTKAEAGLREQYWIAFYNSQEEGYNISPGGEHNTYPKESREKMSKSAKERFLKEEERIKQSERMKNNYKNNPNFHKDLKRPIKCIETGEIFESVAAAGKWANIKSLSAFGNYFRGESKTCGRHPETGERLHWEKVVKE